MYSPGPFWFNRNLLQNSYCERMDNKRLTTEEWADSIGCMVLLEGLQTT